MTITGLLKFIVKRNPFLCFLSVLCLIIAAAFEMLGLASLLPVATTLFSQPEALHAGIPYRILVFLGFQTISIIQFILFLVVAIIFRGALLIIGQMLIWKISADTEADFTRETASTIIHSQWKHILSLGTAKIVDSLTRQVIESGILVSQLAPFLVSLLLCIAFCATVIILSPYALLLAMVIFVFLALALRMIRNISSAASLALMPLHQNKSNALIELALNAKYIKASGIEEFQLNLINTLQTAIKQKNLIVSACTCVMSAAPDTLTVIGVSLLIAMIYGLHLDGGTNFLLSLMLMYRAFHYMNQMQGSLLQIHNTLPSMGNLQSLYEQGSKAREIPIGEELSKIEFNHHIIFRNISFSYDGSTKILHDFSARIEKGQCVVVWGKSGAGKTTLIDLLIGLHRPTNGEILIDNEPLRPANIRSWRDKIAYIPQEPPLFSGTIRGNLTYQKNSISEDRLLRALTLANLADLAPSPTQVLDIDIGERGLKLSGGQRQRLLIARALVQDLDVMILDEPTSALDVEGESLILEHVINNIRGQKTIILITHRMNPAIKTDLIIQLQVH